MRVSLVVVILALTLAAAGDLFAAEPLVHEAVIDAPVAEVWKAWTTGEGLESWMAAHADIDLRIGGAMRSTYRPDGVLGDESTITNTIMSFVPQRMISFRNTGQPANFPFKKEIQSVWTVLLFEPVSEMQTRLTVTSQGYADDEGSKKMRSFFEVGNQQVLQELQEKFKDDADATAAKLQQQIRIVELLKSTVGGEWISESARPDGSIFRSRNVAELGADGQSTVTKSWLGDAQGMFMHGVTQTYREPNNGGVRFLNINETGGVARGALTLLDEHTIQWDWNMTTLEGQQQRYRVEMHFETPDAYTFKLYFTDPSGQPDGVRNADIGGGAERKLVEVKYQRVKQAPDAFLKMKETKGGH